MENQAKTIAVQNAPAADSGVTKEANAGTLTVDEVKQGKYDEPGELTAQLRQVITTISHYPKKRITNDMQDNVFSQEEFGVGTQDFETKENRVTWFPVPKGSTVASVNAKLAEYPAKRLYKVLSNRPILNSNQKSAINNRITTESIIAEGQVIRYPENPDTLADGTAGKIVLDPAGKVQYRAVYFSATGKADEDRRTADSADFYAPTSLSNELGDRMDTTSVADQNADQKM